MNWTRGYGSHLILEDVWGTPGQNNTGEWKKLLTDAEFDKTSDPMFKEITMYCSLEEFVLTGRSNSHTIRWMYHDLVLT